MKKIVLIAITLLLLSTGAIWGQEKLVLYDLDAFESAAGKVNQDDYKNMVKWAREVFQKYSEKKTVSFTKKDFDDTKKAKDDAEKEIERLQKENGKASSQITTLNQDKQNLETEKNLQKRRADSLESVVNARNKTIEDLQKSNASASEKDITIMSLNNQISKQATIIRNQDAALNRMREDSIQMRKQLEKLAKSQDTIDDLNNQLAEKNKTINALNEQITLLTGNKNELEGTIQAYQEAFKDTKNTIYTVYDDYKNKQLVDMDEARLLEAEKAWIGMQAVIERADNILAKDLKGKVEEITLWESAVAPMKGAKNYLMQDPYNEKICQTWRDQLKKLKLSGNKAKECDQMVRDLENQKDVKENYDKILRNLSEFGCLPDSEQLKEAKGMLALMKVSLGNSYRENCYGSYDTAIKAIEKELNDPRGPSKKVENPDNFKTFISDLRKMF